MKEHERWTCLESPSDDFLNNYNSDFNPTNYHSPFLEKEIEASVNNIENLQNSEAGSYLIEQNDNGDGSLTSIIRPKVQDCNLDTKITL